MLELSANQLWKEGSEWLKQVSDTSHLEPATDAMPEECAQELKATTKSLQGGGGVGGPIFQ